jgi:hypothetical protein
VLEVVVVVVVVVFGLPSPPFLLLVVVLLGFIGALVATTLVSWSSRFILEGVYVHRFLKFTSF